MHASRAGSSLHVLHARRPYLPAFLCLSLLVFCTGLALPVVTFEKLFRSDRVYSVLGGVLNLFRNGKYGLGLLVVGFSVIFPVAKLLVLLALWYRPFPPGRRRRILSWLKLLGKWSMLDVFVVLISVGVVQLGMLASAEVRPGMYVFCAGLLLSMATTFLMDRAARAPAA